jgi:D-lactate dehydrogenase
LPSHTGNETFDQRAIDRANEARIDAHQYGAIVDASAVIEALKKKDRLSYFGMDVYEEEGPLLFSDLSSTIIQDDVFERLTTFPNVVITGHQAFLTREALTQIADITLGNVSDFEAGTPRAENIITTRK